MVAIKIIGENNMLKYRLKPIVWSKALPTLKIIICKQYNENKQRKNDIKTIPENKKNLANS